MDKELNLVAFFSGLPLGIIFTLLILLILWRYGKKRRWFDERSKRVHEHAMSISWIATTGGILLIWSIIILYEGPGLAFWLMTALWVIHIGSFGIGTAFANRKN